MPHTGLFLLHTVNGDIDASTQQLSQPRSVKALCLTCHHQVDASEPPDLEIIEGGVILYCRNCGTRQALTDARFTGFWERVRMFREITDD